MLIASIILNVILSIVAYIYMDLYKTFGSTEAMKNFREFDEKNGVNKMLQKQAETYILNNAIPYELVREQLLRGVNHLKNELCKILQEDNVERVGSDGVFVFKDSNGKYVFSMTDEQILNNFYSDTESLHEGKVQAAIEILQQKVGLHVQRDESCYANRFDSTLT